MKKIVALLLLCVLALGTLSSCVTDAADITVTLKFVAGDDSVFNQPIKVTPVDGQVTVIQVVNEAIAQFDIQDITVAANGYSISKAGNYTATTKDDKSFFWMYTIDGVEPTSGRADSNTVTDGQTIQYTFYYSVQVMDGENASSSSYPYDSALELFGENGEEETEEETTAEDEAA